MYATPHFISGSKWLVNIEQRPKRSRWMASVWPERKPSQGYENMNNNKNNKKTHLFYLRRHGMCLTPADSHRAGQGGLIHRPALPNPSDPALYVNSLPSRTVWRGAQSNFKIMLNPTKSGRERRMSRLAPLFLQRFVLIQVWDRCPDECFMCGREVNLIVYIRKPDDTLLPILHYNHQIILTADTNTNTEYLCLFSITLMH